MMMVLASDRIAFAARLLLAAGLLGTGLLRVSPAMAGINPDVSEFDLLKFERRTDGSTSGATNGFFFEACAKAVDVRAAGPGLIFRPGGGSDALIDVGNDTYCFISNRFTTAASLDGTYGSGIYTFRMNAPDGFQVNYNVTLNAVHPPASPVITDPVLSEKVISDRDLLVTWGDLSGCTACDGIDVGLFTGTTEVYRSAMPPLAQSATSTTVPSANLATGTTYQVEVETFDGSTERMSGSQNGDSFTFLARYQNISRNTGVAAVARTIDLNFVEIFKGVGREDGAIRDPEGYFFEACVDGTGIAGAPKPEIIRPDGSTVALEPDPQAPQPITEYCVESEFDDQASLDQEFPGGQYRFNIDQADGARVKIVVDFSQAAPAGSIAYTNPANQAMVAEDQDLNVTWSLIRGNPACTIPGSCGDFIAFFFVDENADSDLVADLELDMVTTSRTVPASNIEQGKAYQIEAETYAGQLGKMVMDGATDEYVFSAAKEDINQIRVIPEPGALLLQAGALLVVIGLARRRRR